MKNQISLFIENGFKPKALFIALFLVSISFVSVYAQGVSPDHVAKMNTVNSSVISPDGKYVAYTVSTPADPIKENSPNSNHLYILDTATGESKAYFTSGSVSQVTFRPEKGTFAFLSRKAGDNTNALYEVSVSGGEATKVFSHSTNILGYDWQADGNHMTFSAMEQNEGAKSPLSYKPTFYEENFSQRRSYIQNVAKEGHVPHLMKVRGSATSIIVW